MAFGRLDRNASGGPISEINVTPLVDVMLVLVVIFLLTAPLLASSIRLDLPQAASAAPAQVEAPVVVVIDKAGKAFIGDQPADNGALAARFGDAMRASAQAELQLRADAGVPYGRVVEVMGLAQKAGLTRIGFMAEPTPAAGQTP